MTSAWTQSPEAERELGRRSLGSAWPRLRHASRTISAYWLSDQWPIAWALLTANLAYPAVNVSVLVRFTSWQRDFFNALAAHNLQALPGLLGALALIVLAQAVAPLIGLYLSELLKLNWRIWLTNRYIARWSDCNRYYDVERARMIDNPDQRITEDVMLMSSGVIALVTGIINSVATAITFSVVVYHAAPDIRLFAFGRRLEVPGGMMIASWVYAIISTWLVSGVAKLLTYRTMRQQHAEGDLRFNLVNVRRNSEQIAFYDAASVERERLWRSTERVWRTGFSVINASALTNGASYLFSHAKQFVPLLFLLPQYLGGGMTLGRFMQIGGPQGAVAQLQNALASFLQVMPFAATQAAVFNRLKALDDAMDTPQPDGIRRSLDAQDGMSTHRLVLNLPDGEPLSVGDWSILPGERWMLTGPSGSGKSSILRVLAGLWTDGRGRYRCR